MKNLNQNKATGPDELPARVLKEAAAEIAPIITHIFQQSYNTSKLPDDWLQALVTPIHKKSLKGTGVYVEGTGVYVEGTGVYVEGTGVYVEGTEFM